MLVNGLALAQTTSDYFLHGTGPDNNPPTLFLDTTAPTASAAKFRDSAGVTFSGGNPWKEIGAWPAATALTTGTLTTLSDLHVWLGLKNSDDQGTQFDLRAEVFKNGTPITSGLTRCITGITRNPANAKEVTVALGSFSPLQFNGTSDVVPSASPLEDSGPTRHLFSPSSSRFVPVDLNKFRAIHDCF